MSIDIHSKSLELLESLANSIHDREPQSVKPFFFSLSEIHVAEKWIRDFIKEINRDYR